MDILFPILYWIALLFTALSAALSGEETYQKDSLQNRFGLKPPISTWHIWMQVGVIWLSLVWEPGVEEAEGFPLIGTRHLVALPMIIIGRIIEIYISNHWQPTQPQKRYRPFPPSPSIWFIWVWTTLIFLLLFREKTPGVLLVILGMTAVIILIDYWQRTHPSQYHLDRSSDYDAPFPLPTWLYRWGAVFGAAVLLLTIAVLLLVFLRVFFLIFVSLINLLN